MFGVSEVQCSSKAAERQLKSRTVSSGRVSVATAD